MSADNWAVCPRCKYRALKKFEKAGDAVQAMYGNVTVEEFDATRAALSMDDVGHTFREDYEFYDAETGTVEATYSGGCEVCGLSVTLKASEHFWSPSDG